MSALKTKGKREGPDWTRKVRNALLSSFRGNASTRYSVAMEPEARRRYAEVTAADVLTCGLVVSIQNPWLARTSEGVVMHESTPQRLLEIKCPIKEEQLSAGKLVKARLRS